MEDTVYKVAMSIPTEGHTLPEAYDNHLVCSYRLGVWKEQMKHEGRNPRYEFYWYTTGRLLTQMAREKLMRVALDSNADFVIMYDDDMVLPPDMVQAMLMDMEQHPEIDILAPLAFMRSPPHFPVMYVVHDGYDTHRHQSYYVNETVKKYPRNKLVECDAVGFGGVCIRMSMVKRMQPPFFMSTTATGEDIMFCVNAKKQANARIFMDTRIKLGHISAPPIITEEYVDRYNADNKIAYPDKKHKYAVDQFDTDSDYIADDGEEKPDTIKGE